MNYLSRSIILAVFLTTSCQRLDSNLYDPEKNITEYKQDAYEGDQEFILDNSYNIADSLVKEFTLNSKSDDETSSTKIYAIYIGRINNIKTDTVIMYCHGNATHMDRYWQRTKLLANTGSKNRFGVLIIDYRGYGLSEGEPTEEGLYSDVDAALKWLKEKGLTSDRLIIYGYSMGSAPATELTANPRTLTPSKLILEAPFASAEVMVQDAALLDMPSSFYVNLEIDNAEEIKKVDQPFLWFHGIDDDYIKMETNGEVVFKNYSGEKGIPNRIERAHHNDVPEIMGFEEYSKVVLDFIVN